MNLREILRIYYPTHNIIIIIAGLFAVMVRLLTMLIELKQLSIYIAPIDYYTRVRKHTNEVQFGIYSTLPKYYLRYHIPFRKRGDNCNIIS